jgi:hypothetical protein
MFAMTYLSLLKILNAIFEKKAIGQKLHSRPMLSLWGNKDRTRHAPQIFPGLATGAIR